MLSWTPFKKGTLLLADTIAVEVNNEVLASILAKQAQFVGVTLFEKLAEAARDNRNLMELLAAAGDKADFVYTTGAPTLQGAVVTIPVELYLT